MIGIFCKNMTGVRQGKEKMYPGQPKQFLTGAQSATKKPPPPLLRRKTKILINTPTLIQWAAFPADTMKAGTARAGAM